MKCIYAASFDPPTLGHLDIIRRAASLCEQLFVIVAHNEAKSSQYMFSASQRREMIESMTTEFPNVLVYTLHGGYLVDFAQSIGANAVVRGIRDSVDCHYEITMANENHAIQPEIETIILPGSSKYGNISSTLVRSHLSIFGWEQRVQKLVTNRVFKALQKHVYQNKVKEYWDKVGFADSFSKIIQHYGSSERAYHNLRHIYEMFCWAETLGETENLSRELIAAIIAHDYCYCAERSDNEEMSANAVNEFWRPSVSQPVVKRMIESTKIGAEQRGYAEKLLHDLDYLIMAANPDRYKEYMLDITKEYSNAQGASTEKRRDFLLSIQDRCFLLDHIQNLYGELAKRNITWELEHVIIA